MDLSGLWLSGGQILIVVSRHGSRPLTHTSKGSTVARGLDAHGDWGDPAHLAGGVDPPGLRRRIPRREPTGRLADRWA